MQAAPRAAKLKMGLYEREPRGPGVQPSFLFRNHGAALTAVGKGRVTCAENTYEGEFVGSKTIKLACR